MDILLKEQKVILKQIYDTLMFAESKNALIVGLNGAIIFGVLNTFPIQLEPFCSLSKWGMWIISCSSISLLIALTSFLPKLSFDLPISFIFGNKTERNILFFGWIGYLKPDEYLLELVKALNVSHSSIELIHKNYAQQIVVNSRIALVKYKYFSTATWILLIGLFPPAIAIKGIIICINKWRSKK